jgi:hypothetical protein
MDLHETLRLVPFQRQLTSAFLFGASTIAWRCSGCRKLSCVPTIHDGTPADDPPRLLLHEFTPHSCVLHLDAEFFYRQVGA